MLTHALWLWHLSRDCHVWWVRLKLHRTAVNAIFTILVLEPCSTEGIHPFPLSCTLHVQFSFVVAAHFHVSSSYLWMISSSFVRSFLPISCDLSPFSTLVCSFSRTASGWEISTTAITHKCDRICITHSCVFCVIEQWLLRVGVRLKINGRLHKGLNVTAEHHLQHRKLFVKQNVSVITLSPPTVNPKIFYSIGSYIHMLVLHPINICNKM